jgi:hypothetical protein
VSITAYDKIVRQQQKMQKTKLKQSVTEQLLCVTGTPGVNPKQLKVGF